MDEDRIGFEVDHLFRRHAGEMVAFLCGQFGFDKIELAEDAVQDAMISAMKTWPFAGPPDNPKAWLLRVAVNRCIDVLRRDNRSSSIDAEPDCDPVSIVATDLPQFETELSDDQLRMIFACCHPSLTPESRVALTLKVVCGFSVGEIARGYLSTAEAVAKTITRAKSKLREFDVEMAIPEPRELNDRMSTVLKALYLMFNEGYSASTGDALTRKDLVFEAIRLASLLARHPVTSAPPVDALAALFCFQAARMPQRADHNGELLILAEQDREAWDKRMISRGLHHFRLSASGDTISDYHLEAEIAAVYTLAQDYPSTDWKRILRCYDQLQERAFSPVRELNRTIVLGQIAGPQTAYSRLAEIETDLSNYGLFFITKAHYEKLLHEDARAVRSLQRALDLTGNEAVRRLVLHRLSETAAQ